MAVAEAKKLSRFSVVEEDRGYRLHVEDEDGDTLQLSASRDQLELIADTLDEILAQDGGDDEDDDEDDDDEEE